MTASVFRTDNGDLRSPWRVAVFGAVFAVSSFGFIGVGLSVVSATPLAGWARTARIPLDQIATVASLVFATWLTGRLAHGDGESAWSRAGLGPGAWTLRPAFVALATGALVILVPSLALVATGGAQFVASAGPGSSAFVAWAAFALLLPAAVGEELIFRGYVFDACATGLGARGAVAATSLAFALAHLFNPDPTVASVTAVACAGIFLAIVRLTTGSLVAASAAHLGINYAQAVGLHATVSGLALQTPGYRYVPTGPAWLTGGAWGPEGGAGVVVALAVASFLCLRSRRTDATGSAAVDVRRSVP